MLLAQILIARGFYKHWKPRVNPTVSRGISWVLPLLWFLVLYGSLMRVPSVQFALRFVPPDLRGAMIAIGNTFGMASVASVALYYSFRLFQRKPKTTRPRPSQRPAGTAPLISGGGDSALRASDRRSLIRAAGAAAIAAPFAFAGFGGIVERTRFQIKESELPVPGLHPDLEGLRIGQLSDLHVSPWLSPADLRRAVDMLNELKPHLTVVTGDLITQAGDPLDEAIRELARLRADAPILGCLGNHERYARCQNYCTNESRRYGIEFLRQKARLLRWGNGVLNVAGVDYQRSEEVQPYLLDAEQLIVPGVSNLLLSHNPDVFPAAVRKGYDAVLSGHTHGGQITAGILSQTLNLARFATPYVAGLYRIDGKSCYVTSGIGTITVPVRIGVPPEITLLRLTKA